MPVLTARRTIAAASMALIASGLGTTSAAAHELDEDVIAAKLCGPDVNAADGAYDADFTDSGDAAEVDLYTYGIGEDDEGNPAQLCTFAIFGTDEDSTLTGGYSLAVGAAARSGAVSGNNVVTAAVTTPFDLGSSATITASGQQVTPKTSAQKKAAKTKYAKTSKAAKAKYNQATKAAKKKYAKAGKSAKAKKAMAKKIASAKKKYRAALAHAAITQKRQTSAAQRAYTLNLTLPFAD